MNTSHCTDIKSISEMNQEELNQYPTEKWMQERGLLESSEKAGSAYYYGGYSYKEVLGSEKITSLFEKSIKNLTETDIYVDIGAGNGKAIKEYRTLYPNGARVIGIAATLPQEKAIEHIIQQDKADPKFSFYLSDFKAFPTEGLAGKVTMITDVIGALRYGRDPACVVRKIGKLLKEGGIVFFKFTYSDTIKIPTKYKEKLYIVSDDQDTSKYLFYLWFYTIRGFDVLHQNKESLKESQDVNQDIINDIKKLGRELEFICESIVLRRNSDPVEVDELTIDPDVNKQEGWKEYDDWYPKYTWVISEYSQAILNTSMANATWLK